jgi:hypothetical protein
MSQAPRTQRIAERLIYAACRRLPADVRADRCQEWTAELPAIFDDQSIRPSFLRTLRALTRVLYDLGSTTLVTTQRCLPILRSQMNPSFS